MNSDAERNPDLYVGLGLSAQTLALIKIILIFKTIFKAIYFIQIQIDSKLCI